MAIKRYEATKDNTITNAFKQDLVTRGTGSNIGQSDILEVFSIYAQATSGSSELSRILIQFPVSGSSTGEIKQDRDDGNIPASGSVNFYLRLYNAKHSQTLPIEPTYNVLAISQSWSEGYGLGMEEYKDHGASNWVKRTDDESWGYVGGDYHTASYNPGVTLPGYTTTLTNGQDDLFLDITSLVEEWIAGSATSGRQNYGLGIFLTSSQEAYFSSSTGLNSVEASGSEIHNVDGTTRSYYTKKFFARGTEFFIKRPTIEARWDSSLADDRGNFCYSSSLAPAADNLNTLVLYNRVRGQLKNIPRIGTGEIFVNLYSGSGDNSEPSTQKLVPSSGSYVQQYGSYITTVITGGYHDTGIYTASFALTSSTANLTKVFDVWSGSVDGEYFTGSFKPTDISTTEINPLNTFFININNLRDKYSTDETARFRLYVRERDWCPTIYTKARNTIENKTIDQAYYKIYRIHDNEEIIGYGTGSDSHTKLSHDISGSYFDLDTSLLESGYMYGIKFIFNYNGGYTEQNEEFKFRIED
jgi:hypothetical protein